MLVDTSGLLCFLNRAERLHELTLQLLSAAQLRLTHSYILAELLPVARLRGIQPLIAMNLLRRLVNDPSFEVVYVDRRLHESALDLLSRREDKKWSLCDAVSFVLMDERNLRDALTTDHHFEQAGFMRLLK